MAKALKKPTPTKQTRSGRLSELDEDRVQQDILTLIQVIIREGMVRDIAPGTAVMAALEYIALSIAENFSALDAPTEARATSRLLVQRVNTLVQSKHNGPPF
jgi:hypothetical protein